MKIKLNVDLNGLPKGRVITIKTNSEGTIIDAFWRARFKDSKIDNCIEIVKEEKPEITKEEKPKTSKRDKK